MQTSTPIEAHDPPRGPSADPICDVGSLRIVVGVIAFTSMGTILSGHLGFQNTWLLVSAMLASVVLRRLLYRRFVGRPALSVLLATGIAIAAAVVAWAVFLRPRA